MKIQRCSKKRHINLRYLATSVGLSFALAGNAQISVDEMVGAIDQLIAQDQLESAKEQLAAARELKMKDERLDILERRLALFDTLEVPALNTTIETIPSASSNPDTTPDLDRVIVADLLDSLIVALENGELDKVQQLSESSEQTDALLKALFANYANVTTRTSELVLDEASQSFFATLEFLELKTFDGDIAYPAENWNLHELRIEKSSGEWQKIRW